MLLKRAAAEFLGSLFLLAIVVGSGIMGDRLSVGNAALALLANSIATGTGLIILIMVFAPISGAHFNPVVTLIESVQGRFSRSETATYLVAQVAGAVAGVITAHLMFGGALLTASTRDRSGVPQMFSEFVATFGLIVVIQGVGKWRERDIPVAVGAYIASAYWFTASTSFANPAVTIARSLTPTFAGIQPANVTGFIVAQLLGAGASFVVFRWLSTSKVDK